MKKDNSVVKEFVRKRQEEINLYSTLGDIKTVGGKIILITALVNGKRKRFAV